MVSNVSRRTVFTAAIGGVAALTLSPRGAFALTSTDAATTLINSAVGEIKRVIAAGQPEAQMLPAFERVFVKYADVPIIARSALGTAARQATPAQIQGFAQAFQVYISRKYGRRFREFIGGDVSVTGAQTINGKFVQVSSTATLKSKKPFAVDWQVSDGSGQNKIFNIIIEGVNMIASERTEIGSMLDARKGNIDALIADLKALS